MLAKRLRKRMRRRRENGIGDIGGNQRRERRKSNNLIAMAAERAAAARCRAAQRPGGELRLLSLVCGNASLRRAAALAEGTLNASAGMAAATTGEAQ